MPFCGWDSGLPEKSMARRRERMDLQPSAIDEVLRAAGEHHLRFPRRWLAPSLCRTRRHPPRLIRQILKARGTKL
jgi:hypothetical protein